MTKILIVDDELDFVKTLEFRLKSKKYEVIIAKNGNEALSTVRSNKPDLILLDYYLPDMLGPEILKKIREVEGLSNVPIIFMSASPNKIKEITESTGIDSYLLKPIDAEALFTMVEKNLKK